MDLEEKVKEILQPHIEKSENDKLEEQDWLPIILWLVISQNKELARRNDDLCQIVDKAKEELLQKTKEDQVRVASTLLKEIDKKIEKLKENQITREEESSLVMNEKFSNIERQQLEKELVEQKFEAIEEKTKEIIEKIKTSKNLISILLGLIIIINTIYIAYNVLIGVE